MRFKMKKFTIILFVSFLFAVNLFSQTPQYYNANSGGIGNSIPFGSLGVSGYKSQYLIGPGEYGQPTPAPAGNITKFYIYMSTSGGPATLTQLLIKMGQTAITSFPAGEYLGQLDTVYYNLAPVLSATANSYMVFTLTRPFNYNPAQSLVIEISHCGYTGTGMNVWQTAGTTGIFRRNNIPGTPSCVFTFSSQDTRILQNGIDIAPPSCNYAWNTQTSGTTSILQSVKAVNEFIGWAVGGAGTVRRTTDGGQTWTNGNPNPGVITGDIYNVEAIDANNAWVTTSPSATFIYRTTNGGTNWTQVHTQAGGFINAIWMINATTGFATGDPVGGVWEFLATTNGGLNWTQLPTAPAQVGSEAGWNNSFFINGTDIWFGTNNTKVYHSTNLGLNWSSGPTTGTVNSYSVHFNNGTNGLAGGSTTAFIVRTTNAGTTYSTVASIPTGTGNITGLEGNGSDYWALRGNHVFRSTNNGDNWTQVYTGTTALWDIDFAIVNGCPQGWAVGATGTIVKMTNITGIGTNNNNQLPSSYALNQNYPNPFNPETKISFALPKAGIVKLAVYDMLGREVAVLENGFRTAGTHSIDFNASNLASGVYLYTLKTGDFTDTKKMVLMK
jgi:hypothetical protein